MPTAAGHRAGARTVRRIVEASIDIGIHDLAVFAFSTENWSRSEEEVDALMEIFAETIERELPDLAEQGVRVRFIGRRDRAPEALRARMDAMEDRTELNTRLNLWVAFDYGGRAELVEAARRLVESGVDAEEIDENVFAANLYAPELPDPDLLIRTSGELRISNFLLWQVAYSRARLRRQALAGLRRTRSSRRAARSTRRAVDGSAARVSNLRLAHRDRDRRLCRSCSASSTSAAGGCSRSSPSRRAIALHEYWLLARPLAPLAPAGYVGAALALVGAEVGGVSWMLGGLLTTFVLAFVLKAISEARAAATIAISAHGDGRGLDRRRPRRS